MFLVKFYHLVNALGTVIHKTYATKKITKEQESLLASFAAAKRLLKKHWRLLHDSGLMRKDRKYILTPSSEIYKSMITKVHGAVMSNREAYHWTKVLSHINDLDLQPEPVQNFKKVSEKLYNHTRE